MSMWVVYRCDHCWLEVRNTDLSGLDGWEETDEGEDLCPQCFRKQAAAAPSQAHE